MNLSNTQRVARYIKVIFLMTKKNAVIIITAVFYFTASFKLTNSKRSALVRKRIKTGLIERYIIVGSPHKSGLFRTYCPFFAPLIIIIPSDHADRSRCHHDEPHQR